MSYAYYPGCSLTESAQEYDVSTRLVFERLCLGLNEITDWTCCGAGAVDAVSGLLAMALPARNLGLAAKQYPGQDLLAPCSACYLNHLRVQRETAGDKKLADRVNQAIAGEDLALDPAVRVRHLLDVLVNDAGPERIAQAVLMPLEGIAVAPYYGCQALRPYPVFDDPERPTSMDRILAALGATALDWDKAAVCCGASLMATDQETALRAVAGILSAAGEADCVATVCPLCQMNLEAYQKQALRVNDQARAVAVVYLPQLMGLAMGMGTEDVLLSKNLALTDRLSAALDRNSRQANVVRFRSNNHNRRVSPCSRTSSSR
ncbi:MAG: CoB--CoM heterodisulfide reductase iron-sulfur subunit B family protein [Thermodesulfobacteriota bacterium]